MKEAPTADQLHRLPYLDMVIKEVLRLYPVAVASFRQATQDDTLPTGDFLPKGTEVVIYMIILHRMEEYWGKDAAEFNPDRWYDIHPEQFPNFIHIYMPFLCGARTCIGQKLALLELKMVLVCLMQAFAFDPVPGHVVKSFISLTLRPSPHVKVHVKALGR
jgi:cytochrome P450